MLSGEPARPKGFLLLPLGSAQFCRLGGDWSSAPVKMRGLGLSCFAAAWQWPVASTALALQPGSKLLFTEQWEDAHDSELL